MVDASVEAGVRRVIPSLFGGRRGREVEGVFPFAEGKGEMMGYVEGKAREVGEGGWGRGCFLSCEFGGWGSFF